MPLLAAARTVTFFAGDYLRGRQDRGDPREIGRLQIDRDFADIAQPIDGPYYALAHPRRHLDGQRRLALGSADRAVDRPRDSHGKQRALLRFEMQLRPAGKRQESGALAVGVDQRDRECARRAARWKRDAQPAALTGHNGPGAHPRPQGGRSPRHAIAADAERLQKRAVEARTGRFEMQ